MADNQEYKKTENANITQNNPVTATQTVSGTPTPLENGILPPIETIPKPEKSRPGAIKDLPRNKIKERVAREVDLAQQSYSTHTIVSTINAEAKSRGWEEVTLSTVQKDLHRYYLYPTEVAPEAYVARKQAMVLKQVAEIENKIEMLTRDIQRSRAANSGGYTKKVVGAGQTPEKFLTPFQIGIVMSTIDRMLEHKSKLLRLFEPNVVNNTVVFNSNTVNHYERVDNNIIKLSAEQRLAFKRAVLGRDAGLSGDVQGENDVSGEGQVISGEVVGQPGDLDSTEGEHEDIH